MSVDILSRAISELHCLPKNSDKRLVNTILDELLSLDFRRISFPKNVIENFIDIVCVVVKPSDGFTVAKACNIICGCIGRSHVSFNSNCSKGATFWLTRCILESAELVLVDILQTLQKIIYGNGIDVSQSHDILVGENGILIDLVKNPSKPRTRNDPSVNTPEEITLLSLQCIQSITFQFEDKRNTSTFTAAITKRCSDLCLQILYTEKSKQQDETNYCKVVICCLCILINLFLYHCDVEKRLPETLGVCRGFMLYRMQKDVDVSLQKLSPSQQSIAELPNNIHSKGGKRLKVRKQRKSTSKADSSPSANRLLNEIIDSNHENTYQPVSVSTNDESLASSNVQNWRFTSDSEMSDSETARETKTKALQAKLRYNALLLLSVLIRKSDRRELFGYWWAFLPSSPDSDDWSKEDSAHKTLTYCAVKEPTSSGRAMALNVILSMVSGSRLYLSQAETSKRPITSFTPFSVTLGCIVTCLHKVMCSILSTERVIPVIIQTLKCTSSIVQATPYHRLGPDLIKSTADSVRKYLTHKDCTIQVAALIVMGCILSVEPAVSTILESVVRDNNTDSANDIKLFSTTQGEMSDEEIEETDVKQEIITNIEENIILPNSWIVEICFKNLGWNAKSGSVKHNLSTLPVRLESLQVLSAISHHHFSTLLLDQLLVLSDILCSVMEENSADMCFHAAKCISSVGDAVLKLDQNEDPSVPLNNLIKFWTPLINGPLTKLLQSQENATAKACVCDCIASVGEKVFERLQRNIQVLIITLLFGSCSDEEPLVRAAAVRALAICVMFSKLRQDICFVSDCGESILRTLSESIPTVRVKASWALGNLSDALVNNLDDPEAESIDNELLIRLFDAAINASNDNEKLKMNAMRSLGNLLRLFSAEQMENQLNLKSKATVSIQRLVDVAVNVSNVKIKWNACYAIGSAMKNEALFSHLNDLLASVFECLVKLVTENRNLKVRINAAVALRSPIKREMYGVHFTFVWNGVMNALENSSDISDFTEYKHKDNLMEQLCVTLAHLTCLLTTNDLLLIEDALCFHGTCAAEISTHIKRRVLPHTDSAAKLLDAAKFVTSQFDLKSDSQRQCMSILQDIFVWEVY